MTKTSTSSNGGILGSGVFGLFGTTIKCDATNNSLFCNIMKLFNILIVLFIVGYILYFAYLFLSPYYLKYSKKKY
jgi:hypothetical protein